jgi:hypothetical protein
VRKQKLSRTEQNKEVRRILSKNDADLSEIQVSCSGTRISLYGTLLKRTGADFNHEGLSNMLSELERVGRVTSELTNWDLNSGVRSLEKNRVSFEDEDVDDEEEYI